MSFHFLARSGATSLLVLAACSTAPSPPPAPGEPFTAVVNRVQGFTDGSFLTAFTDRDGGTWVGGNVAIVLRRPAGGGWSAEPVPIEGTVTGLWQDTDGSMLATAGTQLLVRDPVQSAWEPAALPATSQLLDIWGMGDGTLFLTGVGGTILRRVEGEWSRSETGVTDEIWGIVGNSASDLVAVGQNGTILESDDGGATWHRVASPTDLPLFAVAADGTGRLVAVGAGGIVLLRDGDNWELTATPTTANLFEVRSAGPGRFIAAGDGGVLFEGDGLTWQLIENLGASENLRAITGNAGSRVAAGWFGSVLDEAIGWGSVVNGSRIYAVHTPGDGNAFAVGQGGVAFERVAGNWQPRVMPGSRSYYALAGPRALGRLAVGDGGSVLRFDGTIWEQMPVQATELLRSVWFDGQRAVVVGENGVALLMEGGAWRRVPTGTNAFLRHVGGRDWQHLFAVGDGGVVLRFNGDGFHLETSPTEVSLRGVTTRRNGETWMVGDGGRVYRREGSIWRIVLPPSFNDMRAVHEVDGVLYLAGDLGQIWARDDENESWVPLAASQPGLWLGMGGSDELLLVGEFGTIANGVHAALAALRGNALPVIKASGERSTPH